MFIALALLQSASPLSAEVVPASAKAVVDHIDALYKGDMDRALSFVSKNVENSVSDLKSNLHFPSGPMVTKAMYLSMTRKGTLSLSSFDCKPEDVAVRCDMIFGAGKKSRNYTMRYWADGGPITRVYSWENHDREAK
ncbi:hypothetical protein Sj15T_04810 [Sphingobium sp. TA15]|nr:hypothetical protein Sj15T_04810 [Sphingobium sp. TA15]